MNNDNEFKLNFPISAAHGDILDEEEDNLREKASKLKTTFRQPDLIPIS